MTPLEKILIIILIYSFVSYKMKGLKTLGLWEFPRELVIILSPLSLIIIVIYQLARIFFSDWK